MTPQSTAIPTDPRIEAAEAEVLNVRSRTQAFFVGLAVEMRKPWFGDGSRDMYRALLLRAQEAGLYDSTQVLP